MLLHLKTSSRNESKCLTVPNRTCRPEALVTGLEKIET